jgi:zinc and cadmium transporter
MQALLIYSVVVMAVTWLGGVIPLARTWHERHLGLLTAFASGVLLGAAFLHMIPEAAGQIPNHIGLAVLGGLVFVFLLERVIATHYCEHDHDACDHFQMIGLTFYVGLTLHSIIDGVVLGSGALVPSLGIIVFSAVVAHKLPAVFSLSSILVAGGFRQKRVLRLLVVLSLATPAGAFAAFLGLRGLNPDLAIPSIAIAVSAGTFLYIALTDLLPTVQRETENWARSVAALLVGLLLMWGVGLLGQG